MNFHIASLCFLVVISIVRANVMDGYVKCGDGSSPQKDASGRTMSCQPGQSYGACTAPYQCTTPIPGRAGVCCKPGYAAGGTQGPTYVSVEPPLQTAPPPPPPNTDMPASPAPETVPPVPPINTDAPPPPPSETLPPAPPVTDVPPPMNTDAPPAPSQSTDQPPPLTLPTFITDAITESTMAPGQESTTSSSDGGMGGGEVSTSAAIGGGAQSTTSASGTGGEGMTTASGGMGGEGMTTASGGMGGEGMTTASGGTGGEGMTTASGGMGGEGMGEHSTTTSPGMESTTNIDSVVVVTDSNGHAIVSPNSIMQNRKHINGTVAQAPPRRRGHRHSTVRISTTTTATKSKITTTKATTKLSSTTAKPTPSAVKIGKPLAGSH